MSVTGRDTIYALATAPGRAAIAVVRISGPNAGKALAQLAGALPRPRLAALRTLRAADGAVLDDALVLWFPGPASYTGEDSAELHLHGGRAVVEGVLRALQGQGLGRLAEPGEFTRRAFENGKLDLTQAEAVADLIDAETEAQRTQALDQLDGQLGRLYEGWRRNLVECLALLEAAIDFPDEDLPEDLAARVRPRLEALLAELVSALADAARGERIRDGWRVAIIGAPNAGKSSLFNALVGRDAAIVTPQAGTTRDIIEATLDLGGYRALLADTAGVRVTGDLIEAEGVRRARAWADRAAVRLWLVDGSAGDGAWTEASRDVRPGDILVLTKADRPAGADRAAAEAWAAGNGLEVLSLSMLDPAAAATVLARLTQRAAEQLAGSDFPAVTRERHRIRLAEAETALRRALAALPEAELAAEDLRLAARALARVSGRVDAEDILDVVFRSFCIGK